MVDVMTVLGPGRAGWVECRSIVVHCWGGGANELILSFFDHILLSAYNELPILDD